MWFKRNSSPHLASADNFSKAINTLKDNRPLMDASGNRIQVQSRTAPVAGSRMTARQRRLAARRRAFGTALMMWPTALALQLMGNSFVVWALPLAGMVLFVAYARHSIKIDRQARQANLAPSKSLLSGLGAAGRAAAERLLQTERQFETENTPAWQPATGEFGSTWSAPEPVLPTYTAAEPSKRTPGEFWTGDSLVDAAKKQREAELAALIADMTADEIAVDDNPTNEITRLA
ncbi:MAG: hypothetical protein RL038_1088 [Actinomycetota bacterium]